MSVRLGNGTLGSSQMCGTMPCVVDGQCVHAKFLIMDDLSFDCIP